MNTGFRWVVLCAGMLSLHAAAIPLPEHPRPDFERSEWLNLNGDWSFRFDKKNEGLVQGWFRDEAKAFPLTISVPFPWGAPLSGVANDADVAWYRRTVRVPSSWKGKRVFLIVGASDWETSGWLDGAPCGKHQGGYTPFEFELTHLVKFGEDQQLSLRVDDAARDFCLTGKQGYGNARGIWQTIYLEARPQTYLKQVHFLPDIDKQLVTAKVTLNGPAKSPTPVSIVFKKEDRPLPVTHTFQVGEMEASLDIPLQNVKLWDLEHPYLYEVKATLDGEKGDDSVSTYFGMRKVSVVNMPGTKFPYIALNNKPIYLQLTLDQSYHPGGYYTFPTDEFMKNEILISKRLGLNGNRIHIKVEVPRKLYWADKLGLLIMADVPNSWGEPTQEMFRESEYALRQMLQRDMNHPSIFSWILYNETWGLFTKNPNGKGRTYLPETQERVAQMYRLAKRLDPTRLVEDQSPCNRDHVVSDFNSWHSYAPGFRWESIVADAEKNTYPGSTWNYVNGYKQGAIPMLNSECGNVWGYSGSAGDVDWSWDYHLMMDAFRRHPACCGWLYTEHHDVCNEWNGYVRFDRSEKFTGIEQLFPGMTLRDLHADAYLALDQNLFSTFRPGAEWSLPVSLSLMTDRFAGKRLRLSAKIRAWDAFGEFFETDLPAVKNSFTAAAWQHGALEVLKIPLPQKASAGVVCVSLYDGEQIIARNFSTFCVKNGALPRSSSENGKTVIRFAPKTFVSANWSEKQWGYFEGAKVNGAGKGHFTYEIPVPQGNWKQVTFLAEISSKRLNGKDATAGQKTTQDMDYMRGAGFHDPSKNRNAYPMTDTVCWKGAVRVVANGEAVQTVSLADDPADHRGILSWGKQKRNGFLDEAGSYGYLVKVTIPASVLAKSKDGKLQLRLEAENHGLALYGEEFGRYPMDPTLIFEK